MGGIMSSYLAISLVPFVSLSFAVVFPSLRPSADISFLNDVERKFEDDEASVRLLIQPRSDQGGSLAVVYLSRLKVTSALSEDAVSALNDVNGSIRETGCGRQLTLYDTRIEPSGLNIIVVTTNARIENVRCDSVVLTRRHCEEKWIYVDLPFGQKLRSPGGVVCSPKEEKVTRKTTESVDTDSISAVINVKYDEGGISWNLGEVSDSEKLRPSELSDIAQRVEKSMRAVVQELSEDRLLRLLPQDYRSRKYRSMTLRIKWTEDHAIGFEFKAQGDATKQQYETLRRHKKRFTEVSG
jgi:hypothetical protein